MKGRIAAVLLLLLAVIAAPLLLRRDSEVSDPGAADDRLVILTPHNESIRREFGEAFAAHWRETRGRSLFVDWRAPGGTGDIRRLVDAAFSAAGELGKEGTEFDVFFGGGARDFQGQAAAGHLAELAVFARQPDWFGPDAPVPPEFSGEPFIDPAHRWVGVCVSQFGIVFNRDVLGRAGIAEPQVWEDLADPSYFGRLALADPTKSSSVNQAFVMIVQEQMQDVIRERGDTPQARAEGWRRGMVLLQCLAANARYFTDSASKIPHDVASGNAAAGTAIDFYGRAYEEQVRRPDGVSRVRWIAPLGGTSVSVDPVAVFRGAPHGEVAQGFVEYLLSPEGQLLWNLRPGLPGGPREKALRRLPVRRDLYAEPQLADFTDPEAMPYERTGEFVFRPELTGRAFDALRVIFRAMGMEPHDELKHAWRRRVIEGGEAPGQVFDVSAVGYARVMSEIVPRLEAGDPLDVARLAAELSTAFRDQYRALARGEVAP